MDLLALLPRFPLVRPPLDPVSLPSDLPTFRHLVMDGYDNDNGDVRIHHPAFSLQNRRVTLIFSLPAFDRCPDNRPGVHLPTVLAACCIAACNSPGFLSTTPRPEHRVADEAAGNHDLVLPAGSYYYHLHDVPAEHAYPVCPSFTQWEFDPTVIPAPWKQACSRDRLPPLQRNVHRLSFTPSQMTIAVLDRDRSCRWTAYGDGVQNAHFIPRNELAWFQVNEMRVYNHDLSNPKDPKYVVDDMRNGFACRSDLHKSLDDRVFTFACKQETLVAHFLRTTATIGQHLHNTTFRLFPDACVEFIWARFAWSILPLVSLFASTPGTVIRLRTGLVTTAGGDELDREEQKLHDLTQNLLRRSPKKRKALHSGGSGAVVDDAETVTEEPDVEELSGDGQLETPPSSLVSTVPQLQTPAPNRHTSLPEAAPDSQATANPGYYHHLDPRRFYHFFPDLSKIGETSWSDDYSWQTAPWYPGMEHADRLKQWWRQTHPVGEVVAPDSGARPSQRRRVSTRPVFRS